jgi:hypothetical protein
MLPSERLTKVLHKTVFSSKRASPQSPLFCKIFIVMKVCRAGPRTSNRIAPLTNMNKYLHNNTRETELNINTSVNNGSEKF